MQLCVIVPVPDYRVAAASRATDALWPAVLAHQGEAFRVIEQGCEVDRVRCGHDDRNPSCSPATADRLEPSSYPNPPPRASINPEADKSQSHNPVSLSPGKVSTAAGMQRHRAGCHRVPCVAVVEMTSSVVCPCRKIEVECAVGRDLPQWRAVGVHDRCCSPHLSIGG